MGRLGDATLRLDPYDLSPGAQVHAEVNGRALPVIPAHAGIAAHAGISAPTSPDTAFAVPSSAVRQGDNELHVRVEGQAVGTVELRAVSLDVRYRR